MGEFMGYGVMSTPGVVVDEALVHAGGMHTPVEVDDWVKHGHAAVALLDCPHGAARFGHRRHELLPAQTPARGLPA